MPEAISLQPGARQSAARSANSRRRSIRIVSEFSPLCHGKLFSIGRGTPFARVPSFFSFGVARRRVSKTLHRMFGRILSRYEITQKKSFLRQVFSDDSIITQITVAEILNDGAFSITKPLV